MIFLQPVLTIIPAGIGLASFFFGVGVAALRNTEKGRKQELEFLQRFSSKVNDTKSLASVLGEMLEEILSWANQDAGLIWLAATSDLSTAFVESRGLRGEIETFFEAEFPNGKFLNKYIKGGEVSVIKDLAALEHGGKLSAELIKEGFKTLIVIPIRSGGSTIGALAFANREPCKLSATKKIALSAVTDILGVAVANGRLQEQATKLSEDLIALQDFNKIIAQSFDLEEIVKKIVFEGKRLVKTSHCHLFLLDEQRQNLLGAASTEAEDRNFRSVVLRPSEASKITKALLGKRVIAAEEILQNERFNQEILDQMRWRAAIFAPLLTKDQAIGVLVCSDESRERNFTQEQIFRAETFAHHAAIALENARLFRVVSRSQKEWETTFDAMQDCVSVHDPSGRIVRANVALARRLKTIPQKVIGKGCAELYGIGDSSHDMCSHMSALQSEGLIVEEREVPIMGGTFQISVTPWYDKNNRLAGSIHVAKDVTNEMLLRQQLIQSEKLSAIGELISGIAHELNNPLTGVMGYSQLLQLRKDIDDRAKESLLKINNLALRCQKIVQNLLSFARKQKPERKLSDINDLLERTVELRSYELQVNNIEIIYALDRHLPKTIADSHQIQQVFLNVITNAEQAMLEAHGRGRLIVGTRCDPHENLIVVEVTDDGPGIPDTFLNKIFDPFFTTKEVGKGTGLGLSLSYGIIKEHGGNIHVRSRLGEGATFVVELPVIAHMEQESSLAKELLPQALKFEQIIRDKRILVVDDEKYILDFFTEVFRMYPMHVDTAENGRAALDKMRSYDYDLIVTDFKMPEMSGRELFNWIKAERPQMAKRIIFVTGDTVSSETRSFFEETANRYLAKPFKIEEVKEVMQQTLEACEGP